MAEMESLILVIHIFYVNCVAEFVKYHTDHAPFSGEYWARAVQLV